MKKLTYALTLTLIGLFVSPAYALKIAWFNPNKVLKNTSAGKAVLAKQRALQRKFERERRQGGKPLAQEQAQIEKAWKNFQSNQAVLTAAARKARLKKLKARYDAWMQKVQKYQMKMAKRQQELTQEFQKAAAPFSKKLNRVAAQIARAKSIDYIIAHDPSAPQVLLYANPSLDITSELIRKLK